MAITHDKSLGTATTTTSNVSVSLTTSNAVISGGFIIISVMAEAAALSSVVGGSLTWTVDKTQASGNTNTGQASAQAPSGLAASTVIAANFSASSTAKLICGESYSGVATSSPVDVSVANAQTTSVGWSTTAVSTLNANDLLFASNGVGGTSGTDTPVSPWTERQDFTLASANDNLTTVDQIVSATGSYKAEGNWTATQGELASVLVAYKAASTAGLTYDQDKLRVLDQAVRRAAFY